MIIASLLYTISTYKRFQRNAVLMDSGGNLCVVKHYSISVKMFLYGINI